MAPEGAGAQDAFGVAATRLAAGEAARMARVLDRQSLRRLYPSATAIPLWSMDGRPTRQALEAIDVLGGIRARGLDPAHYSAEDLRADARVLAEGGIIDVARLAAFDVKLSRSLIVLVHDLHAGRVDPPLLGFHLPSADEGLDLEAHVRRASRADDLGAAIAAAEPRYAGYAALKRALVRYQGLAADTGLRLPSFRFTRALRVGDSVWWGPSLRRLLVALGDLGPGGAVQTLGFAADSTRERRYDVELAAAIARFQVRHGLVVDSILGPKTLGQLRVPLAVRVRQIELTLERWRWMPDIPPPRYAVVNVPGFRVALFENDAVAACPALAMNVIVGQAEGRHFTPVFTAVMREVIFRPYWDVPLSIARKELLPIIRRNPAYLDGEQLEIVHGGETDAVWYPPTAENLDRVAAGTLRLRQRPGPNNALGLVKFNFPNPYNVYMHGTPAQSLFAETRRDFSHGCIRVEDPTTFAEFVLEGQPGWDREGIEAAMNGERTLHVRIARPITVFVLYATVLADALGTVDFYADIYGRDAELERALGLPRVTRSP